jgi:phosphosulfolactate phosphohydrolase-like enzyme
LISSFLNLRATKEFLQKEPSLRLLVICSGTFEQAAYEDVLGAGALCEAISRVHSRDNIADSALMAAQLFTQATPNLNLFVAVSRSRNGRRLLSRPELRDDVAFCSQADIFDFAAAMDKHGVVSRIDS